MSIDAVAAPEVSALQGFWGGEARARDFAEMSSDWWWEADAVLHLNWVSDSPMIQTLGFSSRLGLTPCIQSYSPEQAP